MVSSTPNSTNFVVSNSSDSGPGSLREAIQLANATTTTNTITFDPDLDNRVIFLNSGELLITNSVSIQGLEERQIIINGDGESRIFKVDSDGNNIDVSIENLRLQEGGTDDDGGGIWNRDNLTLKQVVVLGNGAADDGGGIRNDGELLVINSVISSNRANGTSPTSGGGGLLNTVGASATIVNSTIDNNTAPNGGGLRNDGQTIIRNSTLSGNSATAATGGGGGIASSGGEVTIQNSTITNNRATGFGAGISTASNVTLTNSIVAANEGDKDVFRLFGGDFSSSGHNLIGNGANSAFAEDSGNNIVGTANSVVDPLLDSLKDNGGPTRTHALLNGSPAINAGSANSLPADFQDADRDNDTAEPIPFDQRGNGFLRVFDDTLDIGAYEAVYEVNNPPIAESVVFSVVENSEKGTVIGTVSAFDPEEDALIFALVDGNLDLDEDNLPAFSIDAATGEISINDADDIDFDRRSEFDLQVRVIDSEELSDTADVKIQVVEQGFAQFDIEQSRDGVFAVGEGQSANLKITLDRADTDSVGEVGFFGLDDGDRVDGLNTTDEGYGLAALRRSQAIFSTLANRPTGFGLETVQRILPVDEKTRLGFVMVETGTIEEAIASLETSSNTASDIAFPAIFSTLSEIQVSNLNEKDFTLNLKEADIALNIELTQKAPAKGTALQRESQSELIDLRSSVDSSNISVDLYREAAFENLIGFYQVNDRSGGIDLDGDGTTDINPGDEGYRKLALENRIDGLDLLATENQKMNTVDGVLDGGSLLAPFMIVNGTLDEALNDMTDVYFSFIGANSDQTDHIRLLGDNTFGFEDMVNGGDQDFNDMILKVNFR